MYVSKANGVTYFDSFGEENIPKQIKTFIGRSSLIKTNIFTMQTYDSMMGGYFCFGLIDFVLTGITI